MPEGFRSDQHKAIINWSQSTWKGLNKSSTRFTIPEDSLWEVFNMLPIGQGNIHVIPGPQFLTNIPTSAVIGGNTVQLGNVLWMKYFEIQNTQYILIAHQNAIQVYNASTNTFPPDSNRVLNGVSGNNCDVAQYRTSQLVCATPSGVYSWTPANGWTTIDSTITGDRIAVFEDRVWVFDSSGGANGQRVVKYSDLGGTSGTVSFSTGTAGAFNFNDSSVQGNPKGASPFYGNLIFWTPDAIVAISDVQLVTVGTAQQVVFDVNPIENEIGGTFNTSVMVSGAFAWILNNLGIWILEGAVPTKVSAELNGEWEFADFVNGRPSMGFANILGVFCWLFLVKWTIDGTNAYRIFGRTWDGAWFSCSPFASILPADHYPIAITSFYQGDQAVCYAVREDNTLHKLFVDQTANVFHIVQTKLYDFGSPIVRKMVEKVGIGLTPLPGNTIQNLNLYLEDESGLYLSGTPILVNVAGTLTFWYDPSSPPITFRWALDPSNPNTALSVGKTPDYVWYGTSLMQQQGSGITRFGRHVGLMVYGTTQLYRLLELGMQVIVASQWY